MTSGGTYLCQDGLATITIDDGKVNVMTTALLGELWRLVNQARSDQAMILLRPGRDKVLSAGFDVKPLASGDRDASRALLQCGVDAILALLGHPFPVISLCAGHGAFGGCTCDHGGAANPCIVCAGLCDDCRTLHALRPAQPLAINGIRRRRN